MEVLNHEASWSNVFCEKHLIPIYFHSSVLHVQLDDEWYNFGGCDENFAISNQLIKFNLKNKTVNVIPYKGNSPQVYRHAVASIGDQIYLYGGDNFGAQSTLFKFDTSKNQWNLVVLENYDVTPGHRFAHTLVNFNNSLYLFGGYNGFERNSPINEIYKLNFSDKLDAKNWEIYSPSNDVLPPIFEYHSSNVIRNEMIIFGGFTYGICSNSLFSFNFDSKKWRIIQQFGDIPTSRYSHTSVIYKNKMFVTLGFSGNCQLNSSVFEFDFFNNYWREIKCSNFGPISRSTHSSCFYNGRLFIFGGFDGNSVKSDIFELNIFAFSNQFENLKNCLKGVCDFHDVIIK
eukprot:gene7201-11517_t